MPDNFDDFSIVNELDRVIGSYRAMMSEEMVSEPSFRLTMPIWMGNCLLRELGIGHRIKPEDLQDDLFANHMYYSGVPVSLMDTTRSFVTISD